MRKKYIILLRTLAMLSIIIGHLLSSSNISYIKSLGQFCYISVILFFFISGFLYGTKKINRGFLVNRIKKVFLPALLFSVIILFIYYFIGTINNKSLIKYLIIYGMNLQYFFDYLFGIGHLWFISIIMLCYNFTILLNKMTNKNLKTLVFAFIILTVLSLFVSQIISQLLIYVLVYVCGYLYGRFESDFVAPKFGIAIYSVSFILSIIGRLFFKAILDDTIIYNVGIVSFSNFICAISMFFIIRMLINDSIKLPKLVYYLDKNSYYIYIVHYIFVVGPLSLMTITNSYLINCIIVVGMSLLFALIFMITFEKVINLSIRRGKIYGK